ncbi:Gfo/Idh/MocA family protein [Fusibacter ferrireducens]|uniref:Gfo/Idh/MocA family oxidoreductase n=1 Tax=Fusibacter ferrireducens TaxID=2785058 RepID=A0ABR9ZYU7_9FIRM|nr:Gfo/Idh/MocA family oxidoreductase [Fusibacter ferrireducens]MBF4695131.1 Gfo/Idh/MocA family oxidoreductase [Fusibacter ferrireducens]
MQKKYKIAMIGLGSIGKRHLRNISMVLGSRGIKYSIDLIRRKNSVDLEEDLKQSVSNIYIECENIPNDYDVIFITNPTHLHYDTIRKYSDKAKNMFIEKPVFDKISVSISKLSLNTDSIYYVACPLRYTRVIQYVKNEIDLDSVYSSRAICSSYLPDWRPGLDYRKTYSAHLNQGGGASIDLIHEWDYMMYLFGNPKKVMNYRGKFSKLEIDSDDLSIYIAEYENMLSEMHLDYFGRKIVRELQLFTEEETIIADIANSEIRFLKEGRVIKFDEDRNSYQLKEIENFFDIIEGKKNNENNIIIALNTLKIAKEGIL